MPIQPIVSGGLSLLTAFSGLQGGVALTKLNRIQGESNGQGAVTIRGIGGMPIVSGPGKVSVAEPLGNRVLSQEHPTPAPGTGLTPGPCLKLVTTGHSKWLLPINPIEGPRPMPPLAVTRVMA
ncbi:MAG: hypothetical protein ABW092_01750 [Candidatus Thiodiazotropha sp.]